MMDQPSEIERLKAIESYNILDTMSDNDYDNITTLASQICEAPISLISLIDNKRQWFKSHYGLTINETPKEYSFCAHAIKEDDFFVVGDARKDARFYDNPLVTGYPHIVFYAAVPLINANGYTLGTLCVIDKEPRELTESQKQSLEVLAHQTMKLLELRKSTYKLRLLNNRLEEKNKILERFAQATAVDINSPLKMINMTYKKFIAEYGSILDDDAKILLKKIQASSEKLSQQVEGLMDYSKLDSIDPINKTNFPVSDLVKDLSTIYPLVDDYQIDFLINISDIHANHTLLRKILMELISNAIRHNDKVYAHIEVGGNEEDRFYEFFVSDNGPGIDEEELNQVFDMYKVFNPVGRYGETGIGIGLTNVRRIVKDLGGNIQIESEKEEGTIVTFTLLK
ncbi:MAG TPA: ATP-binding protein [Cyclobacteriaceae bacterium]